MATDDELMLVAAARQGDRKALQELLTHNWSWLRGLVYSIVPVQDDLDDAMQEICLRVITRIHTLRDPQRFRAWLAILARREAVRFHRRTAKVPSSLKPAVPDHSDGYVEDPAVDVERRELCEQVLDAVRALPMKYRDVFVLAHSGELTYAQIAEVLGVPVTTMQIRLLRARRTIRERVLHDSQRRVAEHKYGK